jgi:hypothetical protein
MTRTGIAILLLSFAIGCSSSKPAPKPLSSGPRLDDKQAAQVLKDAEAKQPCSPQNLKSASEQQKQACDPTKGMFDNVKPAAPATNSPNTKTQRVAKQGS